MSCYTVSNLVCHVPDGTELGDNIHYAELHRGPDDGPPHLHRGDLQPGVGAERSGGPPSHACLPYKTYLPGKSEQF